jgi:hypothetical protein
MGGPVVPPTILVEDVYIVHDWSLITDYLRILIITPYWDSFFFLLV